MNLEREDAEGRHRFHLVGERREEVASRGKRLEACKVPDRGRERLESIAVEEEVLERGEPVDLRRNPRQPVVVEVEFGDASHKTLLKRLSRDLQQAPSRKVDSRVLPKVDELPHELERALEPQLPDLHRR